MSEIITMDFNVIEQSCIPEIRNFLEFTEKSFEFCFGYSLLESLIALKDHPDALQIWTCLENSQKIRDFAISSDQFEYFTGFHELLQLIYIGKFVQTPNHLQDLLRKFPKFGCYVKNYIHFFLTTEKQPQSLENSEILSKIFNVSIVIFGKSSNVYTKKNSEILVSIFKSSEKRFLILNREKHEFYNQNWLEPALEKFQTYQEIQNKAKNQLEIKNSVNVNPFKQKEPKSNPVSPPFQPNLISSETIPRKNPSTVQPLEIAGENRNSSNAKSQIFAENPRKGQFPSKKCEYCRVKPATYQCSNQEFLCEDCFFGSQICPKCRKGKTYS